MGRSRARASLLLFILAAFCKALADTNLDNDIHALRSLLDLQQAELRDARDEHRQRVAREAFAATSLRLQHLAAIQQSQRHRLRLEPVLIAPNSHIPYHADSIHVGLQAVFCNPLGASGRDTRSSAPRAATSSCGGDVRLHVLQRKRLPQSSTSSAPAPQARSPKPGSSAAAAADDEIPPSDSVRVQIILSLHVADNEAALYANTKVLSPRLCVVMPPLQHEHHQAAVLVVSESLRCANETYDAALPWATAHMMPFHDYRMRLENGFQGTMVLNVSMQVGTGSAYIALLGAAHTFHQLTCSLTLAPNVCDHESASVDLLSSALFPPMQHSASWDFHAPASSAASECAASAAPPPTSHSCTVAVVWTFWSNPPPYEMDWLSEVIDSSGCGAVHVLDLQMRCDSSVFSDADVAFGDTGPSRVAVVSFLPKDFERGLGSTEACMLRWNLDGYDPVLFHFGDDRYAFEYLRYPRLDVVVRQYPKYTSYEAESFGNILSIGLGYKGGFWPSELRNISTRYSADLPRAAAARCTCRCPSTATSHSMLAQRLSRSSGTPSSTLPQFH
jgi:hypothetical protein